MKPRHALQVILAHQAELQSERSRWDKFHDLFVAVDQRISAWDDDIVGAYDEDRDLKMETNYPFAYIDTMVASICPTNPQVTISSVDPERRDIAKKWERLANSTMRWNKLYRRGWRSTGHAALCGFGITKTYYDMRRRRPFTTSIHPRRVIWDRSVEDWDDITYIAEATVLRRDQFMARAKRKRMSGGLSKPPQYKASVAQQAQFTEIPQWLRKSTSDLTKDAPKGVFDYVVVWEFYDFVGGNYWHMLDSVEEPLFEGGLPYERVRNPYDLIVFNDNLEDSRGISDIHLIWNSQMRLNEIDTLELLHALGSMPVNLVDEAAIEDPESALDALQHANGPNAHVKLRLKPGRDIRSVFGSTPTVQLSPSFDRMRARTEARMEFTLGLPQYMRGNLGEAEIATEAALANAGLQTRNGRRVRVLEEWQAAVAWKIVALYAENHDPAMPIPVRDANERTGEVLDFGELGFEDPMNLERDWFFEFEAAPYSPAENDAAIQLQNLQRFAPLLLQSPWVDNQKFVRRLLELLKLGDLLSEQPDQGMGQMPGTPGAPGMPGLPGTEEQAPIASGAMDPNLMGQIQALLGEAQPSPPGVSQATVELE